MQAKRLTRAEKNQLIFDKFGRDAVVGKWPKDVIIIQTIQDAQDFIEAFPENNIRMHDTSQKNKAV